MRYLILAAAVSILTGGCNTSSDNLPPPRKIGIKAVSAFYGAGSPFPATYAIAGQAGFQLLINGTGFTNSSVVQWNGSPLPTSFGDSTDIAAQVSAILIVQPGTVTVTVTDSGAASNAVTFGIASPATATAGVTSLVTAAIDGSPANGDSLVAPSISAAGRYVTFQSNATNLAPGPASGFQEIYERDTCTGAPSGCTPSTTRITVTFDGSAVNDHSRDSAISADGRYVAFDSSATNILPNTSVCGRNAGFSCTYLRDTCNGASSGCSPTTIAISVDTTDTIAPGSGPSITPDGRFVSFGSSGSVILGNSSKVGDLFLRDTCIGAPLGCTPSTTQLSFSNSGTQGNQNSGPEALNSTARYLAFDSFATNLVSNPPTDGNDHLYLRDTCLGAPSGCAASTTQLDAGASKGLGGNALDSTVIPGISSAGRFIAFSTNQVGFVSQDVQGHSDAYIRDSCIGVSSGCTPGTQLVSLGNDGAIGNDPSQVDGQTPMSSDGRFVAFESLASNLVPGDTFPAGSFKDVFIRDTCFGAAAGCVPSTVRVSVTDTPQIAIESNAICDLGAISADGHYVVFLSSATNLVTPPANGHAMIYLAKTGF